MTQIQKIIQHDRLYPEQAAERESVETATSAILSAAGLSNINNK